MNIRNLTWFSLISKEFLWKYVILLIYNILLIWYFKNLLFFFFISSIKAWAIFPFHVLTNIIKPLLMKLSNELFWMNFICFYFIMDKSFALVLKDWFYVEAAPVMPGRKGVCRKESQSILRWPKGHFVSWRTWQKVMFWVFSFPAFSPREPQIS